MFVGIVTSLAVLGGQAQLNPAVTIGLWAGGFLKTWSTTQIVGTIVAEFIGAMIGAVLVYLSYLAHWSETEDPGLKLAVFCTGPAIRKTGANLVTEIIGTFMLVFGVVAIAIKLAGGLFINIQGITARHGWYAQGTDVPPGRTGRPGGACSPVIRHADGGEGLTDG